MFWFKPSVINVDCFTYNSAAYHNFAPSVPSKFYPKEFKDLENYVEMKANGDPKSLLKVKLPTIRQCDALIELYSTGFILPMWENCQIEVTSEGKVYHIDTTTTNSGMIFSQHHARYQYGNEIFPEYTHLKLLSPWTLKEKTGVKFTWNMCDWNRTDIADKVKIVSGIIDFKYQTQTNVNCFIKNNNTILYNAGDPLVHLIPLSDKRVKLHTHLMSIDDYVSMSRNHGIFMAYRNHRKLKDGSEVKCPFGFGK